MNFSKRTIFDFVLIVLFIATLVGAGVLYKKYQQAQLDLATQETAAEQSRLEIQKANHALGLAESRLKTEADFNRAHQDEIKVLTDRLKKLTGANKVRPISRDESVVVSDNTVHGGNSSTSETENPEGVVVRNYSWSSSDGRFHLTDPDIATPNNEEFKYRLALRIRGYIFTDETGKLQARQIEVQELAPGPNGTWIPIEGSNLTVEENKFEYVQNVRPKTFWDVFGLRLQAQYDTQLNPGLALEVANLGRYLDWANVGVSAQTSINLKNGWVGLQDSAIGIGVSYALLQPLIDTNVSLGVGILTPVSDLAGRWILTANIGFYLTN
jgi:predicted secreted protein